MTVQDDHETNQQLTDFYRDTVLQHSVSPVGYQLDIHATHQNEQYNPLCGDRITLKFRLGGNGIEAAAFDGEACAMCMASASLLCQHAPGMKVPEFNAVFSALQRSLNGTGQENLPGDLLPLLGVRRYPSRIKCVLLPWQAGAQALSP